MHARPPGYGGGAKQKSGNGTRLPSQTWGERATTYVALFGIQFGADGVVLGIQLDAVVTIHRANAERALDQRIRPTPIHVKPANRFLRE